MPFVDGLPLCGERVAREAWSTGGVEANRAALRKPVLRAPVAIPELASLRKPFYLSKRGVSMFNAVSLTTCY